MVIVGSGYDQPIVVLANQQFSQTKNLISYAAPNIISLTGCQPSTREGSIIDCNRNGSNIITIGNVFVPQNKNTLLMSWYI